MAAKVISVENLHKTYYSLLPLVKIHAVKNISFSIDEGKVVGFLGPNGAGKSTTIQAILGLIHCTKGSINVLGHKALNKKIMHRVGFVAEVHPVIDNMTVRNQLNFLARLSPKHKNPKNSRIDELLNQFHLLDFANRKGSSLSKGMRQKLGFVQALMHDPDILILDEPTSGLDPASRKLFSEIILELKKKGKTILFSSHIITDVVRLCDEAIVIARGELKDHFPLDKTNSTWKMIFEYSTTNPLNTFNSPNVKVTSSFENIIELECQDSEKDLLIKHLIQLDASINNLSEIKTDLEERYINLVKDNK
jgi:ABC-2 type transport system ATP-binding protein